MKSASRRRLITEAFGLILGLAVLRGGRVHAQGETLLDPADPKAKALKYVEDATKVKERAGDATCASCGLYQGRNGAGAGPCQLFPGKSVKATGWCASWAPQM
jgi:hypothetical protein